ncbi:DUF551 domain-containing protein [Escherichia coli]|uniref:DUF551 domain-containing protein n=1 Tax=Escherichia coli TaxID=562 RepID=UPI0022F25E56|nr:DUF551 domain-containing protein [Escherichia coli]MDA5209651.1 DUF551 domain-containing protein [Escherichia coli]MDA5291331.1 DUF551 domain-containing protein [Escherichia coli]MDA5297025.1 DUF551 domain-containing protein [Escherichia coli]MDA5299573.1 DUF551 domain-containing protein [Escherichia coli]MDA5308132.1 DUF551 domain-containing protein [Escherichia coli]
MTTITKERLLTIKQWRETYGPGSNVVLPAEEAEELARIALASLEAEPVAWKATFTQIDHEYNTFTAMYSDKAEAERWVRLHEVGDFRAEITPLYAVPPALVVPDKLSREHMGRQPCHQITASMAKAIALKLGAELNNEEAEIFADGYNAAVLHDAEPVSQTYKLNELAGNYPATPDSWISCSERMPEKNQNVLISVNFDSDLVEPLICSARYTGSTFRSGCVTVKPGNGIEQATHWMPLPEPPQEVK